MTRPMTVASRRLGGRAEGPGARKARQSPARRACAVYGLADGGKKVQNHREEGSARTARHAIQGAGALRRRHRLRLEMANARTGREPGKTVTRADLSEIVYQRVGLSRTESAELVQSVLDEICDAAVARGDGQALRFRLLRRPIERRADRTQPEDGRRGADPSAPRHGLQAVQRSQGQDQRQGRRRREGLEPAASGVPAHEGE